MTTYWEVNFITNEFAKDRVQDINVNESKLKVNDTSWKNEKSTRESEPSKYEDV